MILKSQQNRIELVTRPAIIQAIKEAIGESVNTDALAEKLVASLAAALETGDVEALLAFEKCVEANGTDSKCAKVRSNASKEAIGEAVQSAIDLPQVSQITLKLKSLYFRKT